LNTLQSYQSAIIDIILYTNCLYGIINHIIYFIYVILAFICFKYAQNKVWYAI